MPVFTSRKQRKDIKASFENGLLNIVIDGSKPQSFPLAWYPKLLAASDANREDWVLTPTGIRWNSLNEEIAVMGL